MADFAARVSAEAERLQNAGIRAGDRVAVMVGHRPEHAVLAFALVSLRATWVAVNTKLRGSALAHVITHSDPALLIVDEDLLPYVQACGAALPSVRVPNSSAPTTGVTRPVNASPGKPDDVVAFVYTSGTTGPAKGVQVTDRMLRAAASGAWFAADPSPGDVMLLWEPLFHIGGNQVLLLPLLGEVSLAFIDRLSVSRFWEVAAATEVTHVHHLGGLLQMLLNEPPCVAEREHRVRVMWGGGVQQHTWEAAEHRFDVRVTEGYGMTEASSFVTVNRTDPHHGVGRPLPHARVDVVDDQGRPAACGETGEVWVCGVDSGLVTPGYFRDPDATAAKRAGSWFRTGDLGRWDDDGCLHFLGRMGDSMRIRGENVSAWEIEQVAAAHPKVAECAAVGVPGALGDQEALLLVQLRDSASIGPADIVDWCRQRAAPHHVPRYVKFVESFPKTSSQRIVKRQLDTSTDSAYDATASATRGR